MEKLILKRVKDEVFFENRKLVISKQASKGAGNEVVKILGLPHSNGKQWISLSKLAEGINEVECTARVVTSQLSKPETAKVVETYKLNVDEQSKVDELQKQIDAIITVAKARFVPRPAVVDPSTLTKEECDAEIVKWTAYLSFNNK